jgi:hypothetical protein
MTRSNLPPNRNNNNYGTKATGATENMKVYIGTTSADSNKIRSRLSTAIQYQLLHLHLGLISLRC